MLRENLIPCILFPPSDKNLHIIPLIPSLLFSNLHALDTGGGHGCAAAALRMAAFTLFKSKSALGAYLRRQRSRLCAPKAITATAYKLARLVYTMLKHGTAYVDAG